MFGHGITRQSLAQVHTACVHLHHVADALVHCIAVRRSSRKLLRCSCNASLTLLQHLNDAWWQMLPITWIHRRACNLPAHRAPDPSADSAEQQQGDRCWAASGRIAPSAAFLWRIKPLLAAQDRALSGVTVTCTLFVWRCRLLG